jgi:hypothetical protein
MSGLCHSMILISMKVYIGLGIDLWGLDKIYLLNVQLYISISLVKT